MRAMFGVLGLLFVVFIVMNLVMKQSGSLGVGSGTSPARSGATTGTDAVPAPVANTPAQAKAVQEQVRSDVTNLLEQGAKREGLE